MRICLLEASRVIPRGVHVLNKGRLRWGCRTTPIKVKTITTATGLTGIAHAFRSTIPGRGALCTDSQDISTVWHPKHVMKTESHQTGGRLEGNAETCTYNSLGHSRDRRKFFFEYCKTQHSSRPSCFLGHCSVPM